MLKKHLSLLALGLLLLPMAPAPKVEAAAGDPFRTEMIDLTITSFPINANIQQSITMQGTVEMATGLGYDPHTAGFCIAADWGDGRTDTFDMTHLSLDTSRTSSDIYKFELPTMYPQEGSYTANIYALDVCDPNHIPDSLTDSANIRINAIPDIAVRDLQYVQDSATGDVDFVFTLTNLGPATVITANGTVEATIKSSAKTETITRNWTTDFTASEQAFFVPNNTHQFNWMSTGHDEDLVIEVVVDASDIVVEILEENNKARLSNEFTDLYVDNVSVDTDNIVTATFGNRGNVDADQFVTDANGDYNGTNRYYVLDGDGNYIATLAQPWNLMSAPSFLQAGSSAVRDYDLEAKLDAWGQRNGVEIEAGEYFVMVSIDPTPINAVIETEERANNYSAELPFALDHNIGDLGPQDLYVSDLMLNEESMILSYTLGNNGEEIDASVIPSWNTLRILDLDGNELLSYEMEWRHHNASDYLGEGMAYTMHFFLPRVEGLDQLADGAYQVEVTIDDAELVTSDDTSDNSSSLEFQFEASQDLPDLYADNVSVSQIGITRFEVNFDLGNAGPISVPSTHSSNLAAGRSTSGRTTVYLDGVEIKDYVWTDYRVGYNSFLESGAGSTKTLRFTVDLSEFDTSAEHTLEVMIDSQDRIEDLDESNNTASASFSYN